MDGSHDMKQYFNMLLHRKHVDVRTRTLTGNGLIVDILYGIKPLPLVDPLSSESSQGIGSEYNPAGETN